MNSQETGLMDFRGFIRKKTRSEEDIVQIKLLLVT